MKKRGQVTVFIIVALLIGAGAATYFIVKEPKVEGVDEVPEGARDVYNFVQDCLDKTLEESVYAVAKQGGFSGETYFNQKYTDSGEIYYLLNQSQYPPSLERVEREISEYLSKEFYFCLNNFEEFNDKEIHGGIFNSKAKIFEGEVSTEVNYPIYIKKGDTYLKMEDFESKTEINLIPLYDSVGGFMKGQEETPEGICLTCFKIASENKVIIRSTNDGDAVTFIFKDENPGSDKDPLEWGFAIKY